MYAKEREGGGVEGERERERELMRSDISVKCSYSPLLLIQLVLFTFFCVHKSLKSQR